ncbi:MAG: ParB/RepB/Spo0J family partition protein [Candidatus Omnitrophota bacterium]|nr:ParB/RepB/Spo0J family partition protein [Candidatus Omnitrophota bacterium]
MINKALGKGLSALIQPAEEGQDTAEKILQIPISQIRTNKYQPRVYFDQERLNELISSIKEKGVVQPILVRKTPDGYELIAGERRLRAVKALGVDKVPAIVKNVADVDMLELSLIENIQREELNAIEAANAFQRFITDFNFTQERIAKVLGKDRSTVANIIRLLGLPKKVQEHISKGAVTAGHAKALLSFLTETEQLRVCNLIIKKGLSVREVEALAARKGLAAKRPGQGRDQNVVDIEGQLRQIFGTRVRIFHGKKRGRIQIEYYSNEDLNRILDMLSPGQARGGAKSLDERALSL